MLFTNSTTDIGKAFGVELLTSSAMQAALERWDRISVGKPPWLDGEDGIETVNMAKHISDTRAKLTALDIGIALSGSARADYLQEIADSLIQRLPDKLCEADRLGGMIVKWNGSTWDFILPGDFGVTAVDDNGGIAGAIFASHVVEHGRSFTRLEHHRLEKGGLYRVRNKAFSDRAGPGGSVMLGHEIPLTQVDRWAHLAPEVTIENIERPLFAHYRVPGANTIDPGSPLGLSVFANAVSELKAIDIAVSRKNLEIEDSKHITFVGQNLVQFAGNHQIQLPRFVKGLGMGLNDNETSSIHEHTPTLLTDQRIKDINFDLSMAGVKCGFSEGVFVMDGQTGMITATQVEADDRDTIQTIKADRDALKAALEQALYGADVMCTLYGLAPAGPYETAFNFGDITYSYEEDKAHFLVNSGAVSYTRAVEDAVNELASEQTKIHYPSGHVDTIETAVLRAVRTGVGQASGNMATEGMIEHDWDIILVSAHLGARYGDGGENPGNHFWWQGKFYSRTGRTPGLLLFEKATGYGTGEGLCGWNCRHSFGPGDGEFNPYGSYDSEENKRAYDLSQKQRSMEARIRRTKAKMAGLREAGMDDEYNKAARLLERQNTAYLDFCRENGLRPLMERIQTARWTREDARRSILAAKGEKTVAKQVNPGIIEGDERNGGKRDVQFVGKIDRELYKCVSEDITTDEVIITDERVEHIRERHPGHYERVRPFLQDAVAQPDYILEDKSPHTGLLLKEVVQNGKRFQIVLRLHTSTDTPGFKNSIISAWELREKDYARLVRNRKILYKKD